LQISIYYDIQALKVGGGENDVSRMKRGWWNKKVWETLD